MRHLQPLPQSASAQQPAPCRHGSATAAAAAAASAAAVSPCSQNHLTRVICCSARPLKQQKKDEWNRKCFRLMNGATPLRHEHSDRRCFLHTSRTHQKTQKSLAHDTKTHTPKNTRESRHRPQKDGGNFFLGHTQPQFVEPAVWSVTLCVCQFFTSLLQSENDSIPGSTPHRTAALHRRTRLHLSPTRSPP